MPGLLDSPHARGMTGISVLALSFLPSLTDDHVLHRFRNDRQQHIIRRLPSEMQRGDAVENLRRAILRVVMQEGAAAGQLVLEVRELAAAGAAIFIVLAPDGEGDAVSRRRHDGGWPDLDVELDDLTVPKGLFRVVGVAR